MSLCPQPLSKNKLLKLKRYWYSWSWKLITYDCGFTANMWLAYFYYRKANKLKYQRHLVNRTMPSLQRGSHTNIQTLLLIYQYKVVISVCLLRYPIISNKPLDRFVPNFDWKTRKNKEMFLVKIKISMMNWSVLISRQHWVPQTAITLYLNSQSVNTSVVYSCKNTKGSVLANNFNITIIMHKNSS